MKISKETQKEHISRIRRVLVLKSDATILEIRELLQKGRNPLKLDKDYINKLISKIRKERSQRLDRYTVNKVLVEFEDEVKELKRRLWAIASNAEEDSDRIRAIKEIRNSSKDLFDKMFDAGVFKKQLGEVTNLIDLVRKANKDAKKERPKRNTESDKSKSNRSD